MTRKSTIALLWLFAAVLRPGWSQQVLNIPFTNGSGVSITGSEAPPNVQPELVSLNLSGRSCFAPPQPDNGEWRVKDGFCQANMVDCKVPEGTELGLGYELVYSCAAGYRIADQNGTDVVRCGLNRLWSGVPTCEEIRCEPLVTETRFAVCRLLDDVLDCGKSVPPKTVAEISCRRGYWKEFARLNDVPVCNDRGQWEPRPARCDPVLSVCGQKFNLVYVAGGWDAEADDFPWHATLYVEKRSPRGTKKEFICGATIIRANFVLTAAHCVYDERTMTKEDPAKLFVMTGNTFRDYDDPSHDPEKVKKTGVKKVNLPFDYYGFRGNYDSDIALLELQQFYIFSAKIFPACWDSSVPTAPVLQKHAVGRTAGFGRTATRSSSPVLQAIDIPYVPYNECIIPNTTSDNYVFITKDKFCAGYTNGSAVCDGDSGGGLVFQSNKRWYVMGIISVSLGVDTNDGERTCAKHALTLYTKISEYKSWITDVIYDDSTLPPPLGDTSAPMDRSVATNLDTAPVVATMSPLGFFRSMKNEGVYGSNELRWHASLYEERNVLGGTRKEFRCGAMIIEASLLLTARHCVHDRKTSLVTDYGKLFVIAGNVNPGYDSPRHDSNVVEKSEVENVFGHCWYTGRVGNLQPFEMALLQLVEPLQRTSIRPPPCEETSDDQEAVPDLDVRRKLSVFRTARRGSVVCDVNADEGPVIGKDEVWHILGIISVGLGVEVDGDEKNCTKYLRTLYRRGYDHTPWILEVMY